MWLLSRYIISEFLTRFFISLIVLISLFVGIELLSKIWSINAPFTLVSYYYLLRIPAIMVQMIPVSILLAVLMLFSTLSRNNELVALYCSGRSLLRIASPMFLVVVLLNIISFLFSDYILPATNFQAQKVWMVDIKNQKGKFFGSLHNKKAWFKGNGMIYNVRSYNSNNRKISGINIYYFDNSFNMIQHINAVEANYEKGSWVLYNGKLTLFDKNNIYTKLFEKKLVDLSEKPDDFKKVEAHLDYLTTQRLGDYINELENVGVDTSKYKVEYYKRYSLAFAGLIMAIIGLPFSIRQQRRGGVALNLAVGFVLVFIYWIFFSFLLSMGLSGRVNPLFSAWGSNILFFIFALFMIYRMKR